jgi:hypothetical protein
MRAIACPLQLKNENGSDGGGNGEKPLRDACNEIDLIRHVPSPLTEMDRTVSSLRRP